jgi:transposase
LNQTVYTSEFLDPNRTEIQGIPIPRDKQREAIESMEDLKSSLGNGNLPQSIRRYQKRAQSIKPISEKMTDCEEDLLTDSKLELSQPPVQLSLTDVQTSTRNRFGAFYLYQKISEKIGLLPIIKDSFEGDWRKLFILACYLVTTGDPMYYCERWLEKTEAFPVNMSSSSITKLLSSLSYNDISKFYERWINHRNDKEFLALDISSFSSYPQLLPDVGHGYNREGDKLAQINMCLLFGEESQLPFFLKPYHGKLKDVSTLKATLAEIFSLGGNDLTLVMDKGFASDENISCLTEGPMKSNFIMALPFTMDLAKQQPEKFINSIKTPTNVMSMSSKTWGLTTTGYLSNGVKIFIHVYYNVDKAISEEYETQADIKKFLELAKANPDDKVNQRHFKKWLNITRNYDGTVKSVEVKPETLKKALAHSGWLVIISNCIDKAEKTLSIYRTKDVVEKSFHRLKAQLDMRRLRIHLDSTMRSKIFISFLSLVLISFIHKTMMDNELYSKYTLKEVIDILESLHVIKIKNNVLLEPLSSEQKLIYDSFNIVKPAIWELRE